MNDTCRLCLNDNFLHSNIFIGRLVDDLPFYEIINYVYDLKITPDDGFPELICENCFSAVMTFKVYKANAHKAKLEFLRLKEKVDSVCVKEEKLDQTNESDEDASCNDRGSMGGVQDTGSFLEREIENFNSSKSLSIVKVEKTDGVQEPLIGVETIKTSRNTSKIYQCQYENTDGVINGVQEPLIGVETIKPSRNTSKIYQCQYENTDGVINGVQEPLIGIEAIKPSRNTSKIHQCQYCSKTFYRKSHLTGHLVTHTGERPFECHICKKRFSIKGNLLIHLRIHSGNKPFSCDICSKRFCQKSTLQSHLITHTSARPFSCHVCGKTFTFNSSLRKHLRRHKSDVE